MTQTTINQRLKFLIEELKISIRAFSSALDVSEATTRNYLERGTKPSSDYLEKIVRHFNRVNPTWLLTGEGSILIGESAEPHISSHNNSGNNVGRNSGGSVTQLQNVGNAPPAPPGNCEQQLEAANREIQLLRQQSLDKEKIIQLLEAQINKN